MPATVTPEVVEATVVETLASFGPDAEDINREATLEALDIGPGDEVLVPAMTFVASANAVEHVGATPVLVDCDPDTGLIDLDAAEAALTTRTKAVMPVRSRESLP